MASGIIFFLAMDSPVSNFDSQVAESAVLEKQEVREDTAAEDCVMSDAAMPVLHDEAQGGFDAPADESDDDGYERDRVRVHINSPRLTCW